MTREEAVLRLAVLKDFSQNNELKNMHEAIDMAIKALECKRGEWIVLYDEDSPQDGIWKCSMCGYTRPVDDITPINYCPNCGADMWAQIYEEA